MIGDPNQDKLRRYFEECLRSTLPIAPIDLISDSQTRQVVDEVFSRFKEPQIIDYGCGRLRLLNALLETKPDIPWQYTGVDTELTTFRYPEEVKRCESFATQRNRWRLMSITDLRQSDVAADVCVCMNVVHELPILDLAATIEDFRQHLRKEGLLFMVDTSFLPEGEPLFAPIFSWDLQPLFGKYEDLSYTSRSGIPVLFCLIPQPSLPTYHRLPLFLERWFAGKRDLLATLAAGLHRDDSMGFRSALGLGKDRVFDYTYINTVVANTTVRVVELRLTIPYSETEYNECGHDLLEYIVEVLGSGSGLSIPSIYSILGKRHRYAVIHAVLDELARPTVPSILIGPYGSGQTLMPSEVFDELWDRGLGDIRKQGLKSVLREVYERFSEKREPPP